MPLSWSVAITIVLTVFQALYQFTSVVPLPVKYRWVSAAAQIIIEALLKVQGFFVNPDGTPAGVAYVPQKK